MEKGYLHKIVRNKFSNSRQICDNFAHPSSDVRNEIPAILCKFGAQFATNLRNAPLANAPFSGFLILGPDFLQTFPGCPGVKKFLPTTGTGAATHFLVRTSTILVRTSFAEGFSKNFIQKKFALIFWSYSSNKMFIGQLTLFTLRSDKSTCRKGGCGLGGVCRYT